MWAVEKQRLGETIAEALERTLQSYIVELRPGFEPGARVSIDDLAAAFGVSATPVKDALKRLAVHGLVEIRPRHGVFISQLSIQDVQEISAVRSALEQAAVRMCDQPLGSDLLAALEDALRACEESAIAGDFERYRREDIRFHRLFVEAGRNRHLTRLYQSLLNQLRVVMVYAPRTSSTVNASLGEHRRLLEVAKSGDLHALEAELAAHWERSETRVFTGYMAHLQDHTAGNPTLDSRPAVDRGVAAPILHSDSVPEDLRAHDNARS